MALRPEGPRGRAPARERRIPAAASSPRGASGENPGARPLRPPRCALPGAGVRTRGPGLPGRPPSAAPQGTPSVRSPPLKLLRTAEPPPAPDSGSHRPPWGPPQAQPRIRAPSPADPRLPLSRGTGAQPFPGGEVKVAGPAAGTAGPGRLTKERGQPRRGSPRLLRLPWRGSRLRPGLPAPLPPSPAPRRRALPSSSLPPRAGERRAAPGTRRGEEERRRRAPAGGAPGPGVPAPRSGPSSQAARSVIQVRFPPRVQQTRNAPSPVCLSG